MSDEPEELDWEEAPPPPPRRADPEDYVRAALMAITFGASAEDLRQWWKDEAENRRYYELPKELVDQLEEACRRQISGLRTAPAKPKGKPWKRKSLI